MIIHSTNVSNDIETTNKRQTCRQNESNAPNEQNGSLAVGLRS